MNRNEKIARQLDPAFAVLVGGHRAERLERRWYGRGAARRRRENLREALEGLLARLYGLAKAHLACSDGVYAAEPPALRLITGRASGTDEYARLAAGRLGVDLHLVSAGDVTDGRAGVEPVRGVAFGAESAGGRHDVSESAYRLRDHLALTFSDVLVVVWDGEEPDEIASGAGRMLRDAIMRRQCVLLLRLDPDHDRPQPMLLDAARLTDAALTRLDVMEVTTVSLLSLFEPLAADDARLDAWMGRILRPYAPALDPDNSENRLLRRIEAQTGLLGYLRDWLLWVTALVGIGPERGRPPGPWRWLKGLWLWLSAMLEPPERSQASRVLELLHTEGRGKHRRHRLLHRLHRLVSALAMLDFSRALAACRAVPRRNQYDAIRPGPSLRADHPIVEPGFEGFFNWSDEQARLFATRHQDDTWMIYYAAALAVFAAVAGALQVWPAAPGETPFFWIAMEFVLLHFIVRRVLKARYRDYHGHWIRFRFLAEQLRYLRLGYPLLAIPETFFSPSWRSVPRADAGLTMRLESAELWLLQRLLVAEGIPRGRDGRVPYRMSEHNAEVLDYIHSVLEKHRDYHRCSARDLQRNQRYLHRLAFGLFFSTFVVVTLHFLVHLPWSLFFTAFFPAWGAAIHGILAQNEVARLSAMSGQVWRQLSVLEEAFDLHRKLLADYAVSQTRWMQTQELRELVIAATHILSDANRYWRSLLRHTQAELP